jgi:hypothetical protein
MLGVVGVASATSFTIANYTCTNLGGVPYSAIGTDPNFQAYGLTDAGTVTGYGQNGDLGSVGAPNVADQEQLTWTKSGGLATGYIGVPPGVYLYQPDVGNDSGTRVWTDGSTYAGDLWKNGAVSSPSALSAGANWINSSGLVAAGNMENGTPGSIYSTTSGTTVATLPGTGLFINNDGIVGGTENSWNPGFVYNYSAGTTYWKAGTTTLSAFSSVQSVSQNDQYIAGIGSSFNTALLYQGNGTSSPTLVKTLAGEGYAVNNIGWMGGDSDVAVDGQFSSTAWLWDGTTQHNLNTEMHNQFPSTVTSGFTICACWGINDSNQVLVWGGYLAGQQRVFESFLLTPIPTPEPSTLLLLASGAMGLAAYAWRKRK